MQPQLSFKRKKTNVETKFQSKFDYLCGSLEKLSPKKRYGAIAKLNRLEVGEIIYLLNHLACYVCLPPTRKLDKIADVILLVSFEKIQAPNFCVYLI